MALSIISTRRTSTSTATGSFMLVVGLSLATTPPAYAQTPTAIQIFTQENKAACTAAGGTPKILDSYLTPVDDLNDDGTADYVTDLAGLECANAWSYFCGSAGCPVTVWLSGPQGYTVGWGGSAQAWRQQGTQVIVSLHGQLCKPPRIGAQSCDVAMRFDQASNEPEGTTGARSAAKPATVGGWQLRQAGNGSAVAEVTGVGSLTKLSVLCLRDRPVMMAALSEATGARTVVFTFAFADRSIDVTGTAGTVSQKTFILDPRTEGLAAALSGNADTVDLRVAGRDQGMLSLKGSTSALRGALSSCMPL